MSVAFYELVIFIWELSVQRSNPVVPRRQEVVGTCKVLPIGRAHATFPFMQPPVPFYRLAISHLCL
jgi:hypothetical protein